MTRRIELLFPDHLLAYDCASCEDNCCKGHGFGLEASSEVGRLLAIHPALSPFLVGSDTASYGVDNFRPGCPFLSAENRCTIEQQMGRDSKPLLCRLFPINKLSLYGETVVVDVHPLCTLGLAAYSGSSAQVIAHGPILEEFSESILAMIDARSREPYESSLRPFANDLLSLELAVRDRAKDFFQQGDFDGYVCFQSERTESLLAPDRDRDALHPPLDRAAVGRFRRAVERFFGLDEAPLSEVDRLRAHRISIAMTCSVRQRFFLNAASKIEREQDFSRALTRLPWILVGLEVLFRAAVSLNRERNVVATLNGITEKEQALLRMLAMFPTTPAHSGKLSPQLDLHPGIRKPFFELVNGLTRQSRASRSSSFHELLESLEVPMRDRATLLRALDRHADTLVDWFPPRPAPGVPHPARQARPSA